MHIYSTKKPPAWRFLLLALADDFRTLGWEEVFKHTEIALNQLKELAGRC
jgi:hypothetical protein